MIDVVLVVQIKVLLARHGHDEPFLNRAKLLFSKRWQSLNVRQDDDCTVRESEYLKGNTNSSAARKKMNHLRVHARNA